MRASSPGPQRVLKRICCAGSMLPIHLPRATRSRRSRSWPRSALLLLSVCSLGASADAPTPAELGALWRARTTLRVARELIAREDHTLAATVLAVGEAGLRTAGGEPGVRCPAAPSATGLLLEVASKDLLLAYALRDAADPGRSRELARAALTPVAGFLRFGTEARRPEAAALESEIQSALERSQREDRPLDAEALLRWWSQVESWCHLAARSR